LASIYFLMSDMVCFYVDFKNTKIPTIPLCEFRRMLIFALRKLKIISVLVAGVVELVDTLDLGSSAARCESSSLSACTT
jgi:hypothetical protein